MAYIDQFLIIILGLSVGSFLNTIISRLPQAIKNNKSNHSIFYPIRSHCTFCKKSLSVMELIPIYSWIYLQGRCQKCRKSIPIRYVMVEIMTPILFYIFYYQFNLDGMSLIWMFFLSISISLACIDFEHYLLPDVLTLSLLVSGVLLSAAQLLPITFEMSLFGAFAAFTLFLIINALYKYFFKIEGLGQGDVKYFSAIGSWFGLENLSHVLWVACLSALICVGLLSILRAKKIQLKHKIPFGTFLSLAAIYCFLTIPLVN